jgi:uncharacterized OB-fold protein
MSDPEARPFRLLPKVTPLSEPFWRGGEHDELRFLRCADCGYYVHPPAPRCGACLSKDVAPEAVSGRGAVYTFTWNHQPWVPAPDHPYPIAVVALDEQPDLRLMTNLVNCDPERVAVGLRVRVVFERHEDVWFPLFEPDDRADAASGRTGG